MPAHPGAHLWRCLLHNTCQQPDCAPAGLAMVAQGQQAGRQMQGIKGGGILHQLQVGGAALVHSVAHVRYDIRYRGATCHAICGLHLVLFRIARPCLCSITAQYADSALYTMTCGNESTMPTTVG